MAEIKIPQNHMRGRLSGADAIRRAAEPLIELDETAFNDLVLRLREVIPNNPRVRDLVSLIHFWPEPVLVNGECCRVDFNDCVLHIYYVIDYEKSRQAAANYFGVSDELQRDFRKTFKDGSEMSVHLDGVWSSTDGRAARGHYYLKLPPTAKPA